MKYIYKPKTNLEKFGLKVYNILVDNFPHTFFVGGMVRDLLLKKKITDIDIATQATPEEIESVLRENKILFNDVNKRFGVVIAEYKKYQIEITTFRKDLPNKNRYPKVQFVTNVKTDSLRRDFTVNSLYLSLKNNQILDFNEGLLDLQKRQIKFIGKPQIKIKQDPLRIIRALRFALSSNFKLEKKSFSAIKKNLLLLKQLTKNKIDKEVQKLKNEFHKKILFDSIGSLKLLDKYFK